MSDYTKANLKAALDSLPIERGDVVFCHSNLGFFGRAESVTGSHDLCEMFFDAIMERIGGHGTLCVPTFTYSFSGVPQEAFDPGSTPAPKMGVLSEWVRACPHAERTEDPCYSVAVVGGRRECLTLDLAENSFDSIASFFARFHGAHGKVLNLNFDAASTLIHWVERELYIPYRFDKTFIGAMRSVSLVTDEVLEWQARSTIWVRYLDDALEAEFTAFDKLAREKGMFRTAKLGRGEMGVISADDTYTLIKETLPSRPWFLTKAEALGVTPDPAKFSELR